VAKMKGRLRIRFWSVVMRSDRTVGDEVVDVWSLSA
jgi:hypothetical protein